MYKGVGLFFCGGLLGCGMIVMLETSAEKHTAILFNLLLLRILIANDHVIAVSFLQCKVGPLSFFFFFFFFLSIKWL